MRRLTPGRYYAWFLGGFGTLLALWLALLSVNAELATTSAGLARQLAGGGLYGRAFLADDHHYKALLYRAKHPRLIALGSSRTMQFRETFFDPSQRFMTAGGAMQDLAEGQAFLDGAIADGAPEMIVLGLDFWWFNDNSGVSERYAVDNAKYESYPYVIAASLTALPKLAAHTFGLAPLPEAFSRRGAVGARARAFGDGFRTDGSHNAGAYYAHTIRDARTMDPDYAYTLSRIARENHPFEGGDQISARAVSQFERMLDTCAAHGIRVVVFLPPFAPEVARALETDGRHAILGAVRERTKEISGGRGVPFFDFTTVPYAGRDCYTDGFHASEYVYAMIAREIVPAERLDGPALRNILGDGRPVCAHD